MRCLLDAGPEVTEQSAPEGVTLLKEFMMRVFVAGATGAIGKQLVPRLVEAGHEVHGMTRSESTPMNHLNPPIGR